MTTKEDLVNAAYAEISLAGYVFDIDPEEKQTALMRLERMAAAMDARGIRIGYNLAGADAQLTDPVGIPDWAEEAYYTNLAKRLSVTLGKQLLPETLIAAKEGMETLLLGSMHIPQMQMPRHMPIGTGNRRNAKNQQFFNPVDRLTTRQDDVLEPSGDSWNSDE